VIRIADFLLVGSVSTSSRMNQYSSVSVSHDPNVALPNGSLWTASRGPAGENFAG